MRAAICAVFGFAFIAHAAMGQPVLVTSPTAVGPLDTMITGAAGVPVPLVTAEIMVQGTTLTIDGRHEIASLVVTNSGVVNHSPEFSIDYAGDGTDVVNGMHLIVSGDLDIGFGSSISVNGRGAPRGQGQAPGVSRQGGTHAGSGGSNGFDPYGEFEAPSEHGSGGGSWTNATGAPGGGVVRVDCSGTVLIDGSITARGSSNRGGGGAGGGIWISADQVNGAGEISADGGHSTTNSSAHGGGGRVAIEALSGLSSDLVLQARGGRNVETAGAGTVYIVPPLPEQPMLRIANVQGSLLGVTVLGGEVAVHRIEVLSAARVVHPSSNPSLIIDCRVLTIGVGAEISADARGFGRGVGPGSGPNRSGATHAGAGGSNGLPPYGDIFEPTTMGSGGASWTNSNGASGGGSLRLIVAEELRVDGEITADGGSNRGGGGAGGSIWISCGELTGNGKITANGGTSTTNGSANGGGGRVAIYPEQSIETSVDVSAFGGLNGQAAGSGTVYVSGTSSGGGSTLTFRNQGVVGGPTEIGSIPLVGNVLILDAARVSPRQSDDSFQLRTTGDLVVDALSSIDATGRGFLVGQGPGAGGSVGTTSTGRGGGGGHGGEGGMAQRPSDFLEGAGGPSYGDPEFPTTMGSGSGNGPGGGGSGGGYIRLDIGSTIQLDGAIEADGIGAGAGGAGGGILINAGTLVGSGLITASGGDGAPGDSSDDCTGSGGGGGGLIAIYACSVDPAIGIFSLGGVGCDPGTGTPPRIQASYVASSPNSPTEVMAGDTADLDMRAAAGGSTFQWIRFGLPLFDGPTGTGSVISGSRESTLTIENVSDADAGLYICTVAGDCLSPVQRTFVLLVDGLGGNVCAVDADGDGRIDIEDLYYVHQNPVDTNGDGIVDTEDRRCLERYLRRNELEELTNGRR